MEAFFAFLTQDDLDFLKHQMQVREVDDEDAIVTRPPGSNRTGEADLICSMLPANPSPLSQRLLSALIVEEDSEETNRRKLHDGPHDDCLHCTSEDSPCGNCTQIGSNSENAYDIQSEELDLDQLILLELQSIRLFTESVPNIAYREDEEIKMEICKLKDELQQQVSKNKHHLHKLEKAVFKRQKVEERKCEVLAMNKLVESAYNRHMELESGDWELCNIMQGTASCPVQTVVKDDECSTNVKKRELLLEEVNSSDILKGAAALGTTLPWGVKRKHAKRGREGEVQAKEIISRCGSSSSGRQDLDNVKGEMKIKLKPRQRTTHRRTRSAANDLLGKPAEAQKPSLTSYHWEEPSDKMVKVKDEMPASQNSNDDVDPSHDNIPIDLSHLQLPNLEDFDSWLNFDDDCFPDVDSDYMGLAVLMDDLADLNIF